MSGEVLDLITPLDGGKYRVACHAHGGRGDLDRTVDSQDWAVNLEAKHVREYHAGAKVAGVVKGNPDGPTSSTHVRVDGLEVNLSAVAPLVTMAHSVLSGNPEAGDLPAGFIAMWESLVGVTGEAAIDLARQIQSSERTVRAAVVPF